MGDGRWTACPLPGHDGAASLDIDSQGEVVLCCDCLGAKLRWGGGHAEHEYALSDAYFAVKTGAVLGRGSTVKYRGPYRLMFHAEVGVIDAPRVELPSADLSDRASRAADLFRRLYAAQVGEGFHHPGGLAVGLVREWCGCGRGEAHEAIKELVAAGVIMKNGRFEGTILYRPG